jgi:hypothetical protein
MYAISTRCTHLSHENLHSDVAGKGLLQHVLEPPLGAVQNNLGVHANIKTIKLLHNTNRKFWLMRQNVHALVTKILVAACKSHSKKVETVMQDFKLVLYSDNIYIGVEKKT